jgi:hypothetical protein
MNRIGAMGLRDHLTDEALMAQLAAGDDAALTPLHDRYAGLVFRTPFKTSPVWLHSQ